MQQSTIFHCGVCLDLLHREQTKSVASPPTPPGQHTHLCLLIIFLLISSQIFPFLLHCCKATLSSLHCLYSNCSPYCSCAHHYHGVPPDCNCASLCALCSHFICLSLFIINDAHVPSSPSACCSTLVALLCAEPAPVSLETNKRP